MPLASGSNRQVVSQNIREMVQAGHPQRVAVAAALHNADKSRRSHLAMGGGPIMPKPMAGLSASAPHMNFGHNHITGQETLSHPSMAGLGGAMAPRLKLAEGGFGVGDNSPSFATRMSARELYGDDQYHPGGLFGGSGAGRTDQLPRAVAADSFVMPADVVAGLGQGNNLAGAKILDAALSTGPFGTNLPRSQAIRPMGGSARMPAAPRAPNPYAGNSYADGGKPDGDAGVSHVMVASGEYLIPRHKLEMVGNRRRRAKMSNARSDLAAGHEWARELVDKVRKHQKKFLASAPKPKA